MVEMTYLSMLDKATRHERLTRFFSYDIPCIIIARSIPCFDEMLVLGAARKIPIYSAAPETVQVEVDLISFLRDYLAPRETMHGVLVNVLRQRPAHHRRKRRGQERDGHRTGQARPSAGGGRRGGHPPRVGRPSGGRIAGTGAAFYEIRGVGIIDIATMYGVGAVIRSKTIDLEVKLENWQQGKEYDRLGLTDQYGEILGVKVPYILIPIHPGRNLAIVLEVAARNFRLKQMGYNAAQELAHRHMERAMRAQQEESEE